MKHIENEVEETLNSLKGLRRVGVGDEFHHSVMQRVSFLPERGRWINGLRMGIAAMLVLGLTNIMALFVLSSNGDTTDLNAEIAEEFYDSSTYFFDSTD